MVHRWLPIETAPYGEILVWIPFDSGGGMLDLLCRDEDGKWIDNNGDTLSNYAPTHWMPLPEPPLNTTESK